MSKIPFEASGPPHLSSLFLFIFLLTSYQRGISNGCTIYFKVAFKPPATIGQAQNTCDFDGNPSVLEAVGMFLSHPPIPVPPFSQNRQQRLWP